MTFIMGIIAGLASLLMGLWSKTNVHEKHSMFKRVASFVIFAPLGLLGGLAMTECFGIYWAFAIIPVATGSIFSDKVEEWLRKGARCGDGPTAAYFMRLAEQDGSHVSRRFQLNAIAILNDPNRKDKEPRVDDLIEAYNSARNEFGLEPIHGLDEKAPYI